MLNFIVLIGIISISEIESFHSMTNDKFSFGMTKYRRNICSTTHFASANPNDNETPEERQARMAMVRQVQKSFYTMEKPNTEKSYKDSNLHHLIDPINPTILHDLPLWRVQWTELPGFQNVLNVHVPHYTHMFRTIFAQKPKPPWYFGNLYLPNGSENLNNPEYELNPDPVTGLTRSKACLTGTLMQIVDYKEHIEDGRLLLVVQALDKFRVIPSSAVPTSEKQNDKMPTFYDFGMDESELMNMMEDNYQHPYTTATVELIPDKELIERHYFDNLNNNQSTEDKSTVNQWKEAHVLATAESFHWHPFEYRRVKAEQCISGGGISPLTNYDSLFASKLDQSASKTLQNILTTFQKQYKTLPTSSEGPLHQNDNSRKPSNSVNISIRNAVLPDMEFEVWLAMDRMIRLLVRANPNKNVTVPIPSQMLNLLPATPPPNNKLVSEWPGIFSLYKYAETLSQNENCVVGTATKSPFVRVDSLALSYYPDLLRARHLSYVVWFLLDSIIGTQKSSSGDDDDDEITRQKVLEMDSIYERLKAAKEILDSINGTLKIVLPK